MQTEGSIEIDRSIAEVFRLTNDHVAQWSHIVVEDEVLEEKPGVVGSTFRTVTEEDGRRMEFQGVVTRHEPPFASGVHLAGEAFDVDVDYRFEDLSGRTRVTQRSIVTGKGFFKPLLFLLRPFIKKSSGHALEKDLMGLKQFCETRSESEQNSPPPG